MIFEKAFKAGFEPIRTVMGSDWLLIRNETQYPLRGIFSIESSAEVGSEGDLLTLNQPTFVTKTAELPNGEIDLDDRIQKGSELYRVVNEEQDEATVKLILSRL